MSEDYTHIIRPAMPEREHHPERPATGVYLVGGGIVSMAAAAFLIRDGDGLGHNITILEELAEIGGRLDGPGSPLDGYVLRGGRMLEVKYPCTFNLFPSIPTLDRSRTVTQETFTWNEIRKRSSRSWLFARRATPGRPRYSGAYDPRMLFRAFKTLHEFADGPVSQSI